jgi:hypothetical protein
MSSVGNYYSVAQANQLGVLLTTPVTLTCSKQDQATTENFTRVLGAIAQFQLKAAQIPIRQKKWESYGTNNEHSYYSSAIRAYNSAIDEINAAFSETGIYNSEYRNIDKLNIPVMKEDSDSEG